MLKVTPRGLKMNRAKQRCTTLSHSVRLVGTHHLYQLTEGNGDPSVASQSWNLRSRRPLTTKSTIRMKKEKKKLNSKNNNTKKANINNIIINNHYNSTSSFMHYFNSSLGRLNSNNNCKSFNDPSCSFFGARDWLYSDNSDSGIDSNECSRTPSLLTHNQ
jgi:hypothetical protein